MEDDDLAAAITHLSTIPWCAALLSDPDNVVKVVPSRTRKPTGEDEMFARTLKTGETLSSFLYVYREPEAPNARVEEMQFILTLGNGLNGYPRTCHGGMVATILDEVTGLVNLENSQRRAIPRLSYMTAYLNTTYVRPVPTGATVMATATLKKLDGRKLYVEGTIQDGYGTVLAKADALFVGLRKERI